jgi:hypothetical protein
MSEQQQDQQQSFNDRYAALILEEAEKLCNNLITELTNKFMVAAINASSLPSLGNEQKLIHKNDHTYLTEESRYNLKENYNDDQE